MKQAAVQRVFGFEIMPAPFVVAHLQVGLTMQALDAPLADDETERAGVFLTNALTGWEPYVKKPLPFPELEEERDRSDSVKQKRPILVILGNPPYNGFAACSSGRGTGAVGGLPPDREGAPAGGPGAERPVRPLLPHGRAAYRREDGAGHRLLHLQLLVAGRTVVHRHAGALSEQAFDAIRIDCLNGDKYKTGKIAPDGSPDPSIFSSPEDPVGIQVGTAITTLVRKGKDDHTPTKTVGFRHLWGEAKRAALTETAETAPDALYDSIEPVLPLGLPFAPTAVSPDWFNWPALPDLFPKSYPGVKSGRDPFVVDIDLDRLKERIADYFDTDVSHNKIKRRYPTAMRNPREYDAREVRDTLLRRGLPNDKTAGPDRADHEPPDEKANCPDKAGCDPPDEKADGPDKAGSFPMPFVRSIIVGSIGKRARNWLIVPARNTNRTCSRETSGWSLNRNHAESGHLRRSFHTSAALT